MLSVSRRAADETRLAQAGWQGGSSVSEEENKALVRRFFEAQAEGNLEAMKEMMAPDFVDHSLLPGQNPDREGYLQGVAEEWATFSITSITVEDQIARDDKVVTRCRSRSRHD